MSPTYEVAIVGYGPVGQLLASLLGQRGRNVVVIERYADIYPGPRAVHFDDEVGRILQSVGIRADSNPLIAAYDDWYELKNADREALLKVDWRGVGPSWWHTSNFFTQPDLEQALVEQASAYPSVHVVRGLAVTDLVEDAGGVTLTVAPWAAPGDALAAADVPATQVTAQYVVGCDGANSAVRKLLGIETEDLGFFFDWLIVDMVPNQPMTFDPPCWQLCDPKRPTTIVPAGPGRRRWEFMALPGEDLAELSQVKTAWELLEPWGLTPDNSVLERSAIYRFQAQWARRWRKGRSLIAGDAAHLMPPFAGQGMCAGMRDAVNLAWKLDLVLRGTSGEGLLDTYGAERSPHVQHFIEFSIGLGKIICVLDEAEAAERDKAMLAAAKNPRLAPPPPPPLRLGAGVASNDNGQAGLLSIQSMVTHDGQTGLFDDAVGRGWFVLTAGEPPVVGDAARLILAQLGGRMLSVGVTSQVDVRDVDGRYVEWFKRLGADAVVVRPDFYVHAAVSAGELDATLVELADRVYLQAEPAGTSP